MNMIEKVARAIHKYDFPTNKLSYENSNPEDYLAIAKTAIEAMKEPSEKMIEAGDNTRHTIESIYEYPDSVTQIVNFWQAMIQAALEGK